MPSRGPSARIRNKPRSKPRFRQSYIRTDNQIAREENIANHLKSDFSSRHLLSTLRGATFNVTSMLAYGDEDPKNDNKGRKSKKFRRLDQVLNLARTRDYLCIQETKFRAKEKLYFKSHLPHHKILYNNNPMNKGSNKSAYKAGTVIFIHPRVLEFAVVSSEPMAGHEGYLQSLVLKEKGGSLPLSLRINCVYFESSSNVSKRQETQMDALARLSPCDIEFWCGDFNFVENKDDANRDAVYNNTPLSLREKWSKICTDRGIREIPQGLHTFWHLDPDPNKTRSSKIDRFYTNLPEALWELTGPVASALVESNPLHKSLHSHFPVLLNFFPKQAPRGASRPLPRHIFDEKFKKVFLDHWDKLSNPSLDDWKRLVRKKAKDRIFERQDHVDNMGRLQVGLKLLQHLHEQPIPYGKCLNLCKIIPEFEHKNWSPDNPPIKELLSFLNSLYTDNGEPDAREEVEISDAWAEEEKRNIKAKGYNFLKETKCYIPSTRKKLRSLRRSLSESPSADQKLMKEIISGFYGKKVWDKRNISEEDLSLRAKWLENYHNKLSISPDRIHAHVIYRAIVEASSSSSGPDGIPVEAYKVLIDTVVPLLLDKARELESPEFQQDDFNESLLALIPKSESGLIVDTRPISINNFDNRLIAKALVYSITEAVDDLIGQEQQLFIKGRQMTDHIRSLNDLFYKAVEDEEQFFIFFMDTAKAFDTIDHDFILEVLDRQGFPPWFSTSVKNLLSDAVTSPMIISDGSLKIKVTRGVKQGCPLSPLLFILVYDVLIRALQDSSHLIKVKAAADDVAIASPSLVELTKSASIIDDFRRISGLGVNKHKTVILSSLPPSEAEHETVKSSVWPEMNIVDEQKYLGVVFGRTKTWEDMYEPIMDKAEKRAERLGKVISSLQLHKKVVIFNTYISSLFSYMSKFFIAPDSVLKRYRQLARNLLIPFGGKAFSYDLLLHKNAYFGLKQPLRDLWATNVKELTRQKDWRGVHSVNDVEQWIWEKSMRISEHIDFAAAEFLLAYSNWDRLSEPKFSDKDIYNLSVSHGYPLRNKIPPKINKFVPGLPECRRIFEGINSLEPFIPKGLPDFVRSHHLLTFTNALSTHTRKIGIRGYARSRVSQKCFLCGEGPDSTPHIYRDCSVVSDSLDQLEQIAELEGLSRLSSSSSFLFLPLSVSPDKEVGKLTGALMCFNWAVWNTIQKIRDSGLDEESIPPHIISTTMSLSSHWEGDQKSYGSAGKRTPEQKAKAYKYATSLIAQIPTEASIAFTDGSSLSNPGPAGAGSHIRVGDSTTELIASIGKANNNVGELWAIGMTVQYASEYHRNKNLFVLTDSKYSIGSLMGSKKNKGTEEISLSIRQMIQSFPGKVKILWVPGHAGLPGNERADRLADLAATTSKQERLPKDHWRKMNKFEHSVL